MANWFNFGANLDHKLSTAKWLFSEFAGTEEQSLEAEREAGKSLARVLSEEFPADPDTNVQKFVSDLGSFLARNARAKSYEFTFTAVKSPSINAFALPGGGVFVSRRLMEFAKWDQNQVAFAVAHEIGHVVHRHARDQLVANTLRNTLSLLNPKAAIANILNSLCDAYVFSEYSKDCELEADTFAMELLLRSNLKASGAKAFLDRLRLLSRDKSEITQRFFSSHPPIETRLENGAKAIRSHQKRGK